MRQQDQPPETPPDARGSARAYGLALHSSRQGVVFMLRDRGITVADDRLDWEIGGRPDAVLLASIAEVNLRTGGYWMSPIAQCRITFRDGFVLTVSDADPAGARDDAKRQRYRAFVRDLHRRLAALPSLQIRYVTGYTSIQFHAMALCALFFIGMCIGVPITVFFIEPDAELVLLLVFGVSLVWPLLRMLHYNSPGSYEPQQIPTEVLP